MKSKVMRSIGAWAGTTKKPEVSVGLGAFIILFNFDLNNAAIHVPGLSSIKSSDSKRRSRALGDFAQKAGACLRAAYRITLRT